MAKITETKTETEEVKREETVEKIKCDVCGHAFDEDSWEGREFVVDPDINRQYHSIAELDDLFTAYHKNIERHVIDDGYNGSEITIPVDQKSFLEVLAEESEFAIERSNSHTQTRLAKAGLKEEYADKLGTRNFYLSNDEIHHFMYELKVEPTTTEQRHVCDSCHEVIFE